MTVPDILANILPSLPLKMQKLQNRTADNTLYSVQHGPQCRLLSFASHLNCKVANGSRSNCCLTFNNMYNNSNPGINEKFQIPLIIDCRVEHNPETIIHMPISGQ